MNWFLSKTVWLSSESSLRACAIVGFKDEAVSRDKLTSVNLDDITYDKFLSIDFMPLFISANC